MQSIAPAGVFSTLSSHRVIAASLAADRLQPLDEDPQGGQGGLGRALGAERLSRLGPVVPVAAGRLVLDGDLGDLPNGLAGDGQTPAQAVPPLAGLPAFSHGGGELAIADGERREIEAVGLDDATAIISPAQR